METEYEIRKAMLSEMTGYDIEQIIKDKEWEIKLTRINSMYEPILEAVAKWLSFPIAFVESSFLAELNSYHNSTIEELKKELKMRKSPDSVIDLKELKAMVPIANVVRYYVPSYGMRHWNIRCPFHEEKSGSLHVYEKTNSWRCFGCNAWGSAIDFILLSDKCSMKQAIEKLKAFS